MKRLFSFIGLGLLVATGLYEVTITNLTRGQEFTPMLVASHRNGIQVITLGHPARPELATLPEEGNTSPITGRPLGRVQIISDPTNPLTLCPPGIGRRGGDAE